MLLSQSKVGRVPQVHKLAFALLDRERLSGDEIDEINGQEQSQHGPMKS
jgi:hypothetical protein